MKKSAAVRRAVGIAVVAAVGVSTGAGVASADAAGATSVSGVVWFDRDGDRSFGAGDRGAWGSVVQLRSLSGAVLATTNAGQDGGYRFDGVAAGLYRVTGARDGFASTTPGTVPVLVRSRGGGAKADFGLRGGQVTGTVWDDANGDGIRQSGEAGLDNPVAYVGTNAPVWDWTRLPDGEYTIDDLPVGVHTFYSQDAGIGGPRLARSPGHQGTDRTRDSDFDREGLGPQVEFRLRGNRVVAVGGPAVLDAGYYEGVNHGTLTLTADRDTTDLHVGDTVTITATATYTGNAYDDHGAQFALPAGLTSTSVDTGVWRVDLDSPNAVWVRDASPGRTAPEHTATVRITATVTAPIASGAVTGALAYSIFLTPEPSNSASLPVSAS